MHIGLEMRIIISNGIHMQYIYSTRKGRSHGSHKVGWFRENLFGHGTVPGESAYFF